MATARKRALIVRVVEFTPCAATVEALAPAFNAPDAPRLVELRRRYRLAAVAGEGDDFARARRLMNWVRSRWNHGYDHDQVADANDALQLLAAAEKGCRFSCGNYAQTMVQCCLSLGLPARRLGVKRREADFPHGCLGNSGHVVSEVYCRDLGKWVLLDADLNGFYRDAVGAPMGALDLHRAWHQSRGKGVRQILDEPRFVPILEADGISRAQMRKNWRDFNRHLTIDYYYYLRTWLAQGFVGDEGGGVRGDSIAFTGIVHPTLALNFAEGSFAGICTPREEEFDWPVQRTFMSARMLGRRPSRRVELKLEHAMPFFDHFEMAVGKGTFRRVRGDRRRVMLPLGRTRIRARCVDVRGLPGHEARLTIDARMAAAPRDL